MKPLPDRLDAIARDLMTSTVYSAYAQAIYQAAIELRALRPEGREQEAKMAEEVSTLPPRWKSLSDFFNNATDAEREEVFTDVMRKASARQNAARSAWRYVYDTSLPDGAPVAPGTTVYAFNDQPGHWEYYLPPLPQPQSRNEK